MPRTCHVLPISSLLRELIVRATELPMRYDEAGPAGHVVALILAELRGLQALPLQLPMPRDTRLQDAVRGRQPGECLLALALRPEHADEDRRVPQIGRGLDTGDRDEPDPWVLQLAHAFRDHLPDGLVHPSHPVAHTGIQAGR